MTDKNTDGNTGLSPPYVAFQSIKTVAKNMKEHSVPLRVDRSVLDNFSGAVGKQIITALKFLKLTDDAGHPNDTMRALVGAYDTTGWPDALSGVLREAYAPIFNLSLEAASPSQFNENFRKAYPGADAVQRKCMTFFLNAARDAQIKISPYIMKNKKPRSAPTKKRLARTNGSGVDPQPDTSAAKAAAAAAAEAEAARRAAANADKKPSEVLLNLFNKDMKPPEQDALWLLIKFFKAKDK